MKREASIYDPQDIWEIAIQDASKHVTGEWLPSSPCQLLARAVASLKGGTDWLEQEELLSVRAHYMFVPYMTDNKDVRVFVTHLLFLRDILENQEISSTLHSPISFVTDSLANFLFRDSFVHIHVNDNFLRAANPSADFLDVGGFLICQKGDILLKPGTITDVRYYGPEEKKIEVENIVNEIQGELAHVPCVQGVRTSSWGRCPVVASHEIAPEVFEIGEHIPQLLPDTEVWDKVARIRAQVIEVDPSENGLVYIRYPDGGEKSIPKQEFDVGFVVV